MKRIGIALLLTLVALTGLGVSTAWTGYETPKDEVEAP